MSLKMAIERERKEQEQRLRMGKLENAKLARNLAIKFRISSQRDSFVETCT
jgi:hypothetical protein